MAIPVVTSSCSDSILVASRLTNVLTPVELISPSMFALNVCSPPPPRVIALTPVPTVRIPAIAPLPETAMLPTTSNDSAGVVLLIPMNPS